MIAKQLSVFIENRQGRLSEVLNVLKNNNISLKELVNDEYQKKIENNILIGQLIFIICVAEINKILYFCICIMKITKK